MTRRRFAVIGDPVEHSLSPRMHAAAYAALGIDASYGSIRASESDLPFLVKSLQGGKLDGLNVTIPHKRRILSYVDYVDVSARNVGGANTLARADDGRVVAYNTDVAAIAVELRQLAPDIPDAGWKNASTLILGTGATARSAAVALGRHLGVAQITIRGRSLEEGDKRDAFHAEVSELLHRARATATLRLEPWAPIVTTDREVLVIIQATSLGMKGADPGEIAAQAVSWRSVFPESVALDVVYSEAATPFLKSAERAGMRITDGRGMLARQGALAFEIWFRRAAPFEAMRAALAT